MIKTYSVDELAESLACTSRWLTEQVRANKFPAHKVARQWRFTDQDVAAILLLCANRFSARSDATHPVSDVEPLPAAEPVTGLTPSSRRRLGRS